MLMLLFGCGCCGCMFANRFCNSRCADLNMMMVEMAKTDDRSINQEMKKNHDLNAQQDSTGAGTNETHVKIKFKSC